MSNILVFIFLFFLVVYIAGLVNPKQTAFTKHLGQGVNRKKLSKTYLPILIILFFAIGFTAPPIVDTASVQPQPASVRQPVIEKDTKTPAVKETKIDMKEEKQIQPIAFIEETQNDASLPAGQKKVLREGVNGEKTLTYLVAYQDKKETKRLLTGETVTVQPVSKVIAIGTYVAPAKPKASAAPAPLPASAPTGVYYKNCTAARAAGAAPVYRGQAGYGAHLDRDGDGIGCE